MANRATWSSPTTQLFLQLLLEEKNSGNWSGKSATTKGYKNVSDRIRQITGLDFNKAKLKNKFDTLRGVFHMYHNLFRGQTGAGYDYATNNLTMPDSWWEAKILENEAYRKFRTHGLENGQLMYNLYSDSSATGQYQYTPTALPQLGNPINDENSGGDDTPPATPRLNQDSTSPSPDVAGGCGQSRLSGSKRKKSGDDSWKTTMESLNINFSTVQEPTEYVVKIVKTDENIGQFQTAMNILYSLPGVVPGDHLFALGLQVIGDFNLRNVFLNLRTDADRLMFLRMQDK